MAKQAILEIIADASKLKPQLDQAEGSAGKFSDKLGALGGVLAGALSGAAVVDFGKKATEAFDEAAEANSRLDNALKNNPLTVGLTASAFDELNKALAKHVEASPAVISSAEAQMATFGASKDQIQTMIPTVLDLAAKLGVDAPAAADIFDKATQGNTKGLKVLGIDGYKTTGDKAKDFANIQALLTDKVKGAAQAQLDAAGPGAKIKKSMEELEVSVGSLLVPTLKTLSDTLSKVIDWFTTMPGPMKVVVGIVGGLAATFFVVNAAMDTATAAAAAFGITLNLSLLPVTAIVLGIAGLTAGIIVAYQHCETFRDIVQDTFGVISAVIGGVFNWVRDNWPLLLAILTGPIGIAVGIITSHWDTIKAGFTAVKNWISDRIDDVVGFFTGLPGRLVKAAGDLFGFLKTAVTDAKTWVSNRVDDIVTFLMSIPGRIAGLGGKIFHEIISNIPGAGIVANVAGKIGGILGFATGGTVPGPAGLPQLAIVHGGEVVTPPGAGAGGGGTVQHTYQISVTALDPTTAAETVVRAIDQYEARNGPRYARAG